MPTDRVNRGPRARASAALALLSIVLLVSAVTAGPRILDAVTDAESDNPEHSSRPLQTACAGVTEPDRGSPDLVDAAGLNPNLPRHAAASMRILNITCIADDLIGRVSAVILEIAEPNSSEPAVTWVAYAADISSAGDWAAYVADIHPTENLQVTQRDGIVVALHERASRETRDAVTNQPLDVSLWESVSDSRAHSANGGVRP